MLRVENLTKSFPSGNAALGPTKTALDRVSFHIEHGGVVCLWGPNGSGKTTLLKILAGLLLPDSGRVQVGVLDLDRSLREVQRITALAPGQEGSFYGRLTGLENLRFFARLRGLSPARFMARLEELEEPFQLAEVLDRPYQQASSGMKARLSLARALLHCPRLLLLDEPTKSLDLAAAQRVCRTIREGNAREPERIVMWCTHSIEEARTLAGELLVLSGGRLVGQGPSASLINAGGLIPACRL